MRMTVNQETESDLIRPCLRPHLQMTLIKREKRSLHPVYLQEPA